MNLFSEMALFCWGDVYPILWLISCIHLQTSQELKQCYIGVTYNEKWQSGGVTYIDFYDLLLFLSILLTLMGSLSSPPPHSRLEIELLLQRGVKFEIEALSACSLSFLSEEYVPSKIQGGLFL